MAIIKRWNIYNSIFSEICERIDKKTSKEAGNLILFLEK